MSLGHSPLSAAPLGALDGGASYPRAVIAVPGPLGRPALLAVQELVAGHVAAPSPLRAPAVLGAVVYLTRVAAPSPLGTPALLGFMPVFATLSAPSMLGACGVLAYHDFTGVLGDAITRYVMDLITPTGTLRVPISSWQATLQTGSSNYVQCVIPACTQWVDAINSATEFVIHRTVALPDGLAIEYEMARAPAQQAQFAQGPTNHTCTLSGYSPAFAPDVDPPTAYNRTLTGVRTISSGSSGLRIRCAIDWLLRPAQRAYAAGTPFIVGFINYYVPQGFDAYMDVGD